MRGANDASLKPKVENPPVLAIDLSNGTLSVLITLATVSVPTRAIDLNNIIHLIARV